MWWGKKRDWQGILIYDILMRESVLSSKVTNSINCLTCRHRTICKKSCIKHTTQLITIITPLNFSPLTYYIPHLPTTSHSRTCACTHACTHTEPMRLSFHWCQRVIRSFCYRGYTERLNFLYTQKSQAQGVFVLNFVFVTVCVCHHKISHTELIFLQDAIQKSRKSFIHN